MELLGNRAVRVELGMSTVRASKFARVNRKTLLEFELSPLLVSEESRAKLNRFYSRCRQDLADHCADIDPNRGGRHGTATPTLRPAAQNGG